MDEMAIDRLGIVKLLTQLKDHKACGPDLLPTKIPNEAAEPVYIFLKAIFVKSLSSGTLPRDWKLANITPVYKKGDRSKPQTPSYFINMCLLEAHGAHYYLKCHEPLY